MLTAMALLITTQLGLLPLPKTCSPWAPAKTPGPMGTLVIPAWATPHAQHRVALTAFLPGAAPGQAISLPIPSGMMFLQETHNRWRHFPAVALPTMVASSQTSSLQVRGYCLVIQTSTNRVTMHRPTPKMAPGSMMAMVSRTTSTTSI